MLVALTPSATDGDNVFTAAKPATGSLSGCAIAYNPTLHLTKVGDNEYAGLSKDPRAYTNNAGRVFSVFMPQIGDEFVISKECIDSTDVASVVAGDYLEAKNGQATWSRKTTSPTSGSTAVQVIKKVTIPFPAQKGYVGFSKQDAYDVIVVQQ